MAQVTVRYWASAKAAAGTAAEQYDVATLAEFVTAAGLRHGTGLGRVLSTCSFLVDEVRVGASDPGANLHDGACVEVLPPFAGG